MILLAKTMDLPKSWHLVDQKKDKPVYAVIAIMIPHLE